MSAVLVVALVLTLGNVASVFGTYLFARRAGAAAHRAAEERRAAERLLLRSPLPHDERTRP